MHNLPTFLTVPAHAIERARGTTLLDDNADRVGEAHGIVRGVARQQEHVALADDDVAELAVVDHLEEHGALVLVEPFGRLVNVVVGAGVGATDDLGWEVNIWSLREEEVVWEGGGTMTVTSPL